MAGRNEPLNLWIFGNQGGIRGLAINKPDQALDSESLFRVATVNQNFRFRSVCQHAVHLERLFFPVRPAILPPHYALQYPANSSVRMSSSSTPAPTSIFLMPATMAGGPAM